MRPRWRAAVRRRIIRRGGRPGDVERLAAHEARGRMDSDRAGKARVLSPALEWRAVEPEPGEAGGRSEITRRSSPPPPPSASSCAAACSARAACGSPHFHHGGFFASLSGGFVHYLMTFVLLYAMAILIDGLAPNLPAGRVAEALKLAVYAMTRVCIAACPRSSPASASCRLLALALRRLCVLARPADPDDLSVRAAKVLRRLRSWSRRSSCRSCCLVLLLGPVL